LAACSTQDEFREFSTKLNSELEPLIALTTSSNHPAGGSCLPLLDEIDPVAADIGAVNTVVCRDGKLLGVNTDCTGAMAALAGKTEIKGKRVWIIGAGGAARAVVYALGQAGAVSVTVFNRTAERAAFLVDDLADVFPNSRLHFAPLTSQALSGFDGNVDLVVNTTSVGMSPHVDSCPWPDDVPIPAQATFCDLVYTPLETTFLARARAAGAATIDGLGMLVHQGVSAFEEWTGVNPPADVMRQACLNGLGLKEVK